MNNKNYFSPILHDFQTRDETKETNWDNQFPHHSGTCRTPNHSMDTDRFFITDTIANVSIVGGIYRIIHAFLMIHHLQ